MLNTLMTMIQKLKNEEAQDMVEYALLAGFIAVSAGALLPGVAESISAIFSKMDSVVNQAAVGVE